MCITISVCTNHRSSLEHPSCGASGGDELLRLFQIAAEKSNVNVEAICCLGHCTEGAVVKISPNGRFYHHVTPQDIPTILADLPE